MSRHAWAAETQLTQAVGVRGATALRNWSVRCMIMSKQEKSGQRDRNRAADEMLTRDLPVQALAMGLETYSLRRCRTAAVAAAVLALACSVAAASSSSPADGGGTDDSQTAAAGSTPLIGDASAESHGGARRSLAYDDDDGDHHSRHRRTCHPGYQPGPHGKPQPCPPGTAKVAHP